MTENEVFAKIQKLIEEHFSVSADKVTKETVFTEDLNADSMLKSLRQLAMQCHILCLVKTIRNIRERWSVWARPLLFDIIK